MARASADNMATSDGLAELYRLIHDDLSQGDNILPKDVVDEDTVLKSLMDSTSDVRRHLVERDQDLYKEHKLSKRIGETMKHLSFSVHKDSGHYAEHVSSLAGVIKHWQGETDPVGDALHTFAEFQKTTLRLQEEFNQRLSTIHAQYTSSVLAGESPNDARTNLDKAIHAFEAVLAKQARKQKDLTGDQGNLTRQGGTILLHRRLIEQSAARYAQSSLSIRQRKQIELTRCLSDLHEAMHDFFKKGMELCSSLPSMQDLMDHLTKEQKQLDDTGMKFADLEAKLDVLVSNCQEQVRIAANEEAQMKKMSQDHSDKGPGGRKGFAILKKLKKVGGSGGSGASTDDEADAPVSRFAAGPPPPPAAPDTGRQNARASLPETGRGHTLEVTATNKVTGSSTPTPARKAPPPPVNVPAARPQGGSSNKPGSRSRGHRRNRSLGAVEINFPVPPAGEVDDGDGTVSMQPPEADVSQEPPGAAKNQDQQRLSQPDQTVARSLTPPASFGRGPPSPKPRPAAAFCNQSPSSLSRSSTFDTAVRPRAATHAAGGKPRPVPRPRNRAGTAVQDQNDGSPGDEASP